MDWKSLAIVVLLVAVAATGYWGYDKYTALVGIGSELNNRYENSFQGVNNHIDDLESELGTILISQAPDNLSVNLSNIWRSAYSAQENLGQMPLNDNSLNNVKDLLNNIRQYTKHLDKKVVDGGLSEKDKKMMKSFHSQVSIANKNLERIHDKMDKEKFKWYDKKRVKMNEQGRKYSATPLAGLTEIDSKLDLSKIEKELKSVLPEGVIKFTDEDIVTSLSKLDGDKINQEQAVKVAKKFIKNPETYNYEIISNGRVKVEGGKTVKTHLPAHSVKATNKQDNDEIIYLDITKQGGNVIWLLNQRNTQNKKISYKKAKQEAVKFLKENGYDTMVPVSSKTFNDMMIVSLAPFQNNVLVKPDSVSIQVALDNGEILGFNGVDYILHHTERGKSNLKPKLTTEEAKKKISTNLKLKKEPQLILFKKGNEETLCYEFVGVISKNDDGMYKILINAMNGKEELVKSIDEDFYKNVG